MVTARVQHHASGVSILLLLPFLTSWLRAVTHHDPSLSHWRDGVDEDCKDQVTSAWLDHAGREPLADPDFQPRRKRLDEVKCGGAEQMCEAANKSSGKHIKVSASIPVCLGAPVRVSRWGRPQYPKTEATTMFVTHFLSYVWWKWARGIGILRIFPIHIFVLIRWSCTCIIGCTSLLKQWLKNKNSEYYEDGLIL